MCNTSIDQVPTLKYLKKKSRIPKISKNLPWITILFTLNYDIIYPESCYIFYPELRYYLPWITILFTPNHDIIYPESWYYLPWITILFTLNHDIINPE